MLSQDIAINALGINIIEAINEFQRSVIFIALCELLNRKANLQLLSKIQIAGQ